MLGQGMHTITEPRLSAEVTTQYATHTFLVNPDGTLIIESPSGALHGAQHFDTLKVFAQLGEDGMAMVVDHYHSLVATYQKKGLFGGWVTQNDYEADGQPKGVRARQVQQVVGAALIAISTYCQEHPEFVQASRVCGQRLRVENVRRDLAKLEQQISPLVERRDRRRRTLACEEARLANLIGAD